MKIRIELDDGLDDVEVVIKTASLTDQVGQLQRLLTQLNQPSLVFYKDASEYFVKLEEILFFETDGAKIFVHSKTDAYEVKLKLYELEELLPISFCRISKSSIANVRSVYSLDRSFSGTSRIRFANTHKVAHVSRHYYQLLKERLQELR
ncbi:LytTR family DNA-binding domain-containing protein [Streptococcus acidominimus]|uniref:LytTR family transcriptional regulator n=1 Tax=Streptococcus acidominimus TaxID=1326 RepID=A0A4Y9FSY5_STRAI|nr:LytTR family DNA-binding domain-containing protein [Streptococcus acidominimus]MBF0818277.1 LytTR family transcriptional regulator [Streptococcus acidominimus]MBF0838798.1 LytTR family transcriptional regulator [Streptococcus acidominimus]MBF0845935.1 LytTR family transcriptional regulator [Streptococcus danieliae]TFU31349.1 LytTR family transcriptional regulator [Streptococcus acidominimus]